MSLVSSGSQTDEAGPDQSFSLPAWLEFPEELKEIFHVQTPPPKDCGLIGPGCGLYLGFYRELPREFRGAA